MVIKSKRDKTILDYLSSIDFLKALFIVFIIFLFLNWLFLSLSPRVSDSSWKGVFLFLGTREFENSPFFLIITFLFLLNFFLCIFLRELKVVRKRFNLEKIRHLKLEKAKFTFTTKKMDEEEAILKVEKVLKKKYRVEREENEKETKLIAHRFLFNKWSIFLFHLSLPLILLAIFINYLMGFNGLLELAEGYFFKDEPQYYQKVDKGPFFPGYTGFKVANKKFKVLYYPSGKEKFYGTELVAIENGETKDLGTTEPNYPVRYQGRKIFQSKNFGLAVSFVLIDKEGNAYPNLVYFPFKKGEEQSEKKIELPGEITAVIKLKYPEKEGTLQSLKNAPLSFHVSLYKNRKKIREKEISKGEKIKVSDQFDLSFSDVTFYSGLQVSYRPGDYLLYLGFFIAIFALINYYFLSPEVIVFSIKERKRELEIKMRGFTTKFSSNFQEKLGKIWREIVEPN
jgi:cytochrome c biogenesis protein ResB